MSIGEVLSLMKASEESDAFFKRRQKAPFLFEINV
jgi:hypothetical protein